MENALIAAFSLGRAAPRSPIDKHNRVPPRESAHHPASTASTGTMEDVEEAISVARFNQNLMALVGEQERAEREQELGRSGALIPERGQQRLPPYPPSPLSFNRDGFPADHGGS